MSEDDSPAVSDWSERFGAVGVAQNTYLYLLGMAGLFFFVLDLALPETTTTEIPGVGLEVSSLFVWAAGPAVIGFLLAAVLGALDATTHAGARMELGKGEFEREDVGPNAVDMAFYTTADSPRVALALGYLSYPAYLALFFGEGVWLWSNLFQLEQRSAVLEVALWLGAAMLLLGFLRLPRFATGKVRAFWNKLRDKEPTPSFRQAIELLSEAEDIIREGGAQVVTSSEEGRWRCLVDGDVIAEQNSVPALAASVRTWVKAHRAETV